MLGQVFWLGAANRIPNKPEAQMSGSKLSEKPTRLRPGSHLAFGRIRWFLSRVGWGHCPAYSGENGGQLGPFSTQEKRRYDTIVP
jgi:hypothetical protein